VTRKLISLPVAVLLAALGGNDLVCGGPGFDRISCP
jgi:hypothetical protein